MTGQYVLGSRAATVVFDRNVSAHTWTYVQTIILCIVNACGSRSIAEGSVCQNGWDCAVNCDK